MPVCMINISGPNTISSRPQYKNVYKLTPEKAEHVPYKEDTFIGKTKRVRTSIDIKLDWETESKEVYIKEEINSILINKLNQMFKSINDKGE